MCPSLLSRASQQKRVPTICPLKPAIRSRASVVAPNLKVTMMRAQSSYGHVHVDFCAHKYRCRFVHLFFSYFHLTPSPACWVLLPLMFLVPVSSSPRMCGSALHLSPYFHQAVEAFFTRVSAVFASGLLVVFRWWFYGSGRRSVGNL